VKEKKSWVVVSIKTVSIVIHHHHVASFTFALSSSSRKAAVKSSFFFFFFFFFFFRFVCDSHEYIQRGVLHDASQQYR
jgi:hypothetical protein